MRKQSWKPKFNVGDEVIFASHVSARVLVPAGFHKDDALLIVDRSVRARSTDPRQNRYKVVRGGQEGWFYEDDLETA